MRSLAVIGTGMRMVAFGGEALNMSPALAAPPAPTRTSPSATGMCCGGEVGGIHRRWSTSSCLASSLGIRPFRSRCAQHTKTVPVTSKGRCKGATTMASTKTGAMGTLPAGLLETLARGRTPGTTVFWPVSHRAVITSHGGYVSQGMKLTMTRSA